VIFHDYYSKIPADEIDRFIATQEMGRLITLGEDGTPHLGLYNFVYAPPTIELHLVRTDEQITDLKARVRCAFEVDEVLAVIPSHWVHPEYGGSATSYHRTVIFECEGTVAEDPAVVMAQQQRLLAKHQPEGRYRPLAVDDPLYKGPLNHLAAVTLRITSCRAKFKLGQNRLVAARRRVIEELRRRGRPNDGRAADALQWTIDHPFEPGDSHDR
jgi:predicted FMN-binding regulatory protein PaiB